jgi:hypothetical protein
MINNKNETSDLYLTVPVIKILIIFLVENLSTGNGYRYSSKIKKIAHSYLDIGLRTSKNTWYETPCLNYETCD